MDALGGETSFADVPADGVGYVPACTIGVGQKAKLIYGQNVDTLRFFTTCGLQEGYEPFCVNMKRPVTHWYTKDQPIFENNEDIPDSKIDVTRIPGGGESPPCLKISHNLFETMEKAEWEFLRLSLPVTCHEEFISEAEKGRRWNEIKLRQHRLMAEAEHTTNTANYDHLLREGFTMNEIKGLHRNYNEDGIESDEVMRPQRPGRRPSINNNMLDIPNMQRSTSNLDMNNGYEEDVRGGDGKKRGRSPFRLFGKKRDASKDRKDDRKVNQGRNVVQSSLMTKAPTVRVSNVRIFPHLPYGFTTFYIFNRLI